MSETGKRKGWVTAGELLDRLERDPAYQARMLEVSAGMHENLRRYKAAAAPVLADLSTIGYDLFAVGDLRRTGTRYRDAVPVLLKWLPLVNYEPLKHDIVDCLAVPWARPAAARTLIDEFRRDDHARVSPAWTIGNTLSVVADDSVFDEVVELATDRRYGRAREMVAVALGNMRDPRAVDVLIGLLDDDQVAGHAIIGLGKLRAPRSRPYIEPFLTHSMRWWRTEAKRAIAKIDKAAAKGRP